MLIDDPKIKQGQSTPQDENEGTKGGEATEETTDVESQETSDDDMGLEETDYDE